MTFDIAMAVLATFLRANTKMTLPFDHVDRTTHSYSHIGGSFTANFSTDLMILAIYLGLIISGRDFNRKTIKRGILGLLVVITLSVAVMIGGGTLAVNSSKELAVVFLWTGDGILLALAIVCGWGVSATSVHLPTKTFSAIHPEEA
jgi:hypothetical protein